jgi:hypothetical protein
MSETGVGAVKVVSAVDGSTTELDCGIHNFKTTDLAKFNEHIHESGHFDVGTAPCMICGKPKTEYEYKHKTQHVKRGIVMHDDCKEEFIKGL